MVFMEETKVFCDVGDLAHEMYPVLWDTSAILSQMYVNGRYRNLVDKVEHRQKSNRFYTLMRGIVKREGSFCTIQGVLSELVDEDIYDYKKTIKRDSGPRTERSKLLLKLRRLIKESVKQKRRLVRAFEESNRVLDLRDTDEYKRLFQRYDYLKERSKLSGVDFDFLVTGLTVAEREGSVSIVSNDFGIFNARRRILREANGTVNCFARTNFFILERV